MKSVSGEKCPRCGGRTVGRVGVNQFFCGDCCIEYSVSTRGTHIYEIADDGSLLPEGKAGGLAMVLETGK